MSNSYFDYQKISWAYTEKNNNHVIKKWQLKFFNNQIMFISKIIVRLKVMLLEAVILL